MTNIVIKYVLRKMSLTLGKRVKSPSPIGPGWWTIVYLNHLHIEDPGSSVGYNHELIMYSNVLTHWLCPLSRTPPNRRAGSVA